MNESEIKAVETAIKNETAITVKYSGNDITFVPSEIDEDDETVIGKTNDGHIVEFEFKEITLSK